MSKKIYEQLDNEPDAAFTRFLYYRNLGAGRSVRAAFESIAENRGKSRTSGQWDSDSINYRWVERANAYDIDNLLATGKKAVSTYLSLIQAVAQRCLESINDGSVKPATWPQLNDTLEKLGSLIPPETIAALYTEQHIQSQSSDSAKSEE